MKSNLLMDFAVDKPNKKIKVKRAFSAPLDLVWAAWTEEELLDQWWAPRPWQTHTKSMDFSEGGRWLYAMRGPDGEEHWCRTDYFTIEPQKGWTSKDGFCNSEGVMDKSLPGNNWKTDFSKVTGATLVEVQLSFDTLSEMEKILEMGFQEGFTMAMDNLDELLESKVG